MEARHVRVERRDINHEKEQKFAVGVLFVCSFKLSSVTHIDIHALADTYTWMQGNSVNE